VTLTVTADNDAKDLTATKVVIGSGNLPPVADAGGPYTGTVGEEIPFDGSGSRDLDGSIVAYSWDFGDGTIGTGEEAIHTYSEAGVYYATLTVTDDAGLNTSESTEAYIGLDALPPLADAGGPYPGRVDDEITFNGSGSRDLDGSIVSYIWSFGDGTIGTGEEAIHIYSEAGPHPVTLWVIDDSSEWNSDGTVALIGNGNLPPVANAGGPYEGAVGEEITFNGSDSIDLDGNIVSYEWSFGDGNFGSGKTPRHAYSADDVYYVTLTVIDDTGAVDSSGTTAAAADADVFLTRLRVPRGLSFRTGRTQYRLIIVKGDGNTIAQNTAVTLSVMSAPGVTVNVNPTEISKVVSPHDDRPTGYPSIAEITCDAPGSYTLRWTATISAAQNSDPDNDTLTKTTRVSCNGL
jgi:PKD repeat protein